MWTGIQRGRLQPDNEISKKTHDSLVNMIYKEDKTYKEANIFHINWFRNTSNAWQFNGRRNSLLEWYHSKEKRYTERKLHQIESTLGKRILDETIWNSKNGILAESNLWNQPVVIRLLIQENNQITSSSPSSGQIGKWWQIQTLMIYFVCKSVGVGYQDTWFAAKI